MYLFSGALEIEPEGFTTSTGPLFLSSLDCSETDQSLLDDCSHDQLGLASCDDAFGLANVKCFGNRINPIAKSINLWMFIFTDTDECADNTDSCSQNCSDTLGSYQCVCFDGYTLDSDQHTCNGSHFVLYLWLKLNMLYLGLIIL